MNAASVERRVGLIGTRGTIGLSIVSDWVFETARSLRLKAPCSTANPNRYKVDLWSGYTKSKLNASRSVFGVI